MAFASDAAGDAPLAGFLVDLFLGFNKPQAFGTAWAQMLADEWLATVGNLAVVLEAHRKGDSAAWESVVRSHGVRGHACENKVCTLISENSACEDSARMHARKRLLQFPRTGKRREGSVFESNFEKVSEGATAAAPCPLREQ